MIARFNSYIFYQQIWFRTLIQVGNNNNIFLSYRINCSQIQSYEVAIWLLMNVLSDFTKERADRGQHCRHHHGNGHRPASLGHYGSENRGLGLQPGWDGRVLRPWQEVRVFIGLRDQFCLGSEVSCPNIISLAHQP